MSSPSHVLTFNLIVAQGGIAGTILRTDSAARNEDRDIGISTPE
jgi:hypothetical protein